MRKSSKKPQTQSGELNLSNFLRIFVGGNNFFHMFAKNKLPAMDTLKKIRHRDAIRFGIRFGFDGQLKQSTQRIGTRWSQTLQWWWVEACTVFRNVAEKTKFEAVFHQPRLLPAGYFRNESKANQKGKIVLEPFALERKGRMVKLPEISATGQQEKPFADNHTKTRRACPANVKKAGAYPTCLPGRQESLTSREIHFLIIKFLNPMKNIFKFYGSS